MPNRNRRGNDCVTATSTESSVFLAPVLLNCNSIFVAFSRNSKSVWPCVGSVPVFECAHALPSPTRRIPKAPMALEVLELPPGVPSWKNTCAGSRTVGYDDQCRLAIGQVRGPAHAASPMRPPACAGASTSPGPGWNLVVQIRLHRALSSHSSCRAVSSLSSLSSLSSPFWLGRPLQRTEYDRTRDVNWVALVPPVAVSPAGRWGARTKSTLYSLAEAQAPDRRIVDIRPPPPSGGKIPHTTHLVLPTGKSCVRMSHKGG